jgi:carboxymethylenebutenolidase
MTVGRHMALPSAGDVPESSAYAALPAQPTRGVVVIHEILGPQPEIERVVERFAARGYAAVAPTLFDSFLRPSCIRKAMQTMQTGKGPYVDQLRHTRSWLAAQTGLAESRIGLIGFCMGGGFALAAGSGWAAVSTNYGDVPTAEVLQGIGPVIGCYGGRDVAFGRAGAKLEQTLKVVGVTAETHTFPTVGHSFLTDGEHPVLSALSWPLLRMTYDPVIAEEAWQKILAFFDKQL